MNTFDTEPIIIGRLFTILLFIATILFVAIKIFFMNSIQNDIIDFNPDLYTKDDVYVALNKIDRKITNLQDKYHSEILKTHNLIQTIQLQIEICKIQMKYIHSEVQDICISNNKNIKNKVDSIEQSINELEKSFIYLERMQRNNQDLINLTINKEIKNNLN